MNSCLWLDIRVFRGSRVDTGTTGVGPAQIIRTSEDGGMRAVAAARALGEALVQTATAKLEWV